MLRFSLSSAYPIHMLKTIAPVNVANDILAPVYFPGKGLIDFSGTELWKRAETSLRAVLWITTHTDFWKPMAHY